MAKQKRTASGQPAGVADASGVPEDTTPADDAGYVAADDAGYVAAEDDVVHTPPVERFDETEASAEVGDVTVEDVPQNEVDEAVVLEPDDSDQDDIDPDDSDADVTVDDQAEDPRGEDLATDLPDPGPYDVTPDETEAEELDPEAPDDDPEQFEEAEAVAVAASSTRPVRKVRSAKAPVKKVTATPTRKEATATGLAKRTSPAQFIRESIAELRKVVWPTGAQLRQYFVVVLVFVVFVIALVAVLDFGLGWTLLKLLG